MLNLGNGAQKFKNSRLLNSILLGHPHASQIIRSKQKAWPASSTISIMIELIVAFLCGSFVTVVLVVAGILGWLYSQSQKITWEDKDEKPYIHPQLPQVN